MERPKENGGIQIKSQRGTRTRKFEWGRVLGGASFGQKCGLEVRKVFWIGERSVIYNPKTKSTWSTPRWWNNPQGIRQQPFWVLSSSPDDQK